LLLRRLPKPSRMFVSFLQNFSSIRRPFCCDTRQAPPETPCLRPHAFPSLQVHSSKGEIRGALGRVKTGQRAKLLRRVVRMGFNPSGPQQARGHLEIAAEVSLSGWLVIGKGPASKFCKWRAKIMRRKDRKLRSYTGSQWYFQATQLLLRFPHAWKTTW